MLEAGKCILEPPTAAAAEPAVTTTGVCSIAGLDKATLSSLFTVFYRR